MRGRTFGGLDRAYFRVLLEKNAYLCDKDAQRGGGELGSRAAGRQKRGARHVFAEVEHVGDHLKQNRGITTPTEET